MRRLSSALLRVWAGYREGALIRARIVVLLVVVLVLVVGCWSDAGEESDATTSTVVEATTTVTEPTTTPDPAGEAQIDITYADNGTTYVGDRQMIEGTATITFANETDSEAIVALLRYETGSAALAEELEFIEEGNSVVPGAKGPAEPYDEVDLEGSGALMPGSHTWMVDLAPGTYLFDVGPLDFKTSGLWRAAVFEVISG